MEESVISTFRYETYKKHATELSTVDHVIS